jgi:hypothetical protein
MLFKDSPNFAKPIIKLPDRNPYDGKLPPKEFSQKQMEQLCLYENDAMNRWVQEVLKESDILQKMNNKF